MKYALVKLVVSFEWKLQYKGEIRHLFFLGKRFEIASKHDAYNDF